MYAQAAVSVHRNRLKVYNNLNVYLKNKQEFEIELFNPTNSTKLAKISINGKFISTSGIVLKPGQRVYLERFIDEPKKFAFETYTVDGNDRQVAQAIANNGDIAVYFYDEKESNVGYFAGAGAYQRPLDLSSYNRTTSCYYNSASLTNDSRTRSLKSKLSSASEDWMSMMPEEKETGRVEKGSQSNQGFTYYNGEFDSYVTNITRIKILPYSEKPIEIKELAEYCTTCGTRNRKNNYKFCPKCGKRF